MRYKNLDQTRNEILLSGEDLEICTKPQYLLYIHHCMHVACLGKSVLLPLDNWYKDKATKSISITGEPTFYSQMEDQSKLYLEKLNNK